jgi:ACR3 family arsenite efflux pump ArsB
MPITNAGMSLVPLDNAGHASAMNNWVRQCSTSLSIALFSALLAYQISVYVQKGNSISAAASLAVGDAFLFSLIPLILALLLSILLQKEKRSEIDKKRKMLSLSNQNESYFSPVKTK